MRPTLVLIWVFTFAAIVASSFLLEPWIMQDMPTDGDGNLMILIIAQVYYVLFFCVLNLVIGIISIYRGRSAVPLSLHYILPNRKVDGIATILFKTVVFLIALYDIAMFIIYWRSGAFEMVALPLVLSVLILFITMSWMLGVSSASAKSYANKILLERHNRTE